MDSRELSIRAGVELSFISKDTQAVVAEFSENSKIDMKMAKKLHENADNDGKIDRDTIRKIIFGEDTIPISQSAIDEIVCMAQGKR